ncbi:MAG: iron-sulfur cluster assembly accessory protein [Pseudomonadales bacterium]|nr:iron-sulfur cluster assembly accessory protein [Pseudomonadales bacterium]
MTAHVYDPTAISMTPAAQDHVGQQIAREGATGLLLSVTDSGCNGYMYELSYLATEPTASKRFDFTGEVRVYVQEANWEIVCGTEIDYVTEGLNSSLKFNNPNADTLCGCGESFSIRGT